MLQLEWGGGAARQAMAGGLLAPASCSPVLDRSCPPSPAGVALSDRCPLLARKFSQHAAKWVHKVYRSCSAGLGVLACSQRLTDRDNNWWSR